MSANVRKFQSDLEAFAEKIDTDIGVVVTKLALDAWAGITERTPVDTGRARASWTIKESEPSDFIPDKGASEQPTEPVAQFDGTDSVFITSALDYVRYLEDGSSKQAPAGMIEVTLAELEAEVEFILDSLP